MRYNSNLEPVAYIALALIFLYLFSACKPAKISHKTHPHHPYVIEK